MLLFYSGKMYYGRLVLQKKNRPLWRANKKEIG